MSRFNRLPAFEKGIKRLQKKYKTLEDDLEKFEKVLVTSPTGVGENFTIVHDSGNIKIVKARMACRALRDRSLRVIYAYLEQEQEIDFIEIYFKGDKENENRDRIVEYFKSDQS